MTNVLIIGATGKVGRRVAEILALGGHTVRRASRTAGDTRFDWYDPQTHAAALDGVDALYLTGPGSSTDYSPLVGEVLELAARSGVTRAVLLSARGAIFQPDGVVARADCVALAGPVPTTVLRPSWFCQNFTEGILLPRDGVVTAPVGDGEEPFIDVADIAAVAAAILVEGGHGGEIVDLSGPAAMTFADAVATLSPTLRFVPADPGDFAGGMARAGMTSTYVDWRMAMFEGIRSGQDAFLSDGVERVLGRTPTSFADWAAREGAALGG